MTQPVNGEPSHLAFSRASLGLFLYLDDANYSQSEGQEWNTGKKRTNEVDGKGKGGAGRGQ